MIRYKKISILVLSIIFLLIGIIARGQQEKNDTADKPQQNLNWQQRKAQFKADRVAYITLNMNLSVEDAQKFWPVFNKYDALLDQVVDQRHINSNKIKHADSLSESECKDLLNFIFENDFAEIEVKKNFLTELSNLFSAEFAIKYFNTENNFRRQIINKSRISGCFGKSFRQTSQK